MPASARARAARVRPHASTPFPRPFSTGQCHLPACGLPGGHHNLLGEGRPAPGHSGFGRRVRGAQCISGVSEAITGLPILSSIPPTSCLMNPHTPAPRSRLVGRPQDTKLARRSHSTSGEDRRGKYFLLTSPRSEEGTGIWDIGNIKLQNVPRMRSAEMRQRQLSARNQPESIRLTPYYSNPSRMGLQAALGLRRHCLVLRGPPQAELLGPGLRAAEPVPGAAGFGGHEGQLRPSP